jgi:AcrR family transcriptional regulator
MPKLRQEVIEEKKLAIEDAAKELFISQGFHATSMRDIAKNAQVSLGNLYNYYRTKEEILESCIGKYQKIINHKLKEVFANLDEPLEPENIERFGLALKELIDKHHDFWLLMYIDVLEFQNRHFRLMFDGLSTKLRLRFAGEFSWAKQRGDVAPDIDPAVAFTAIYMQFFNYFLVEKLFGGNSHFGLTDEEAIASLTKIFCRGVLSEQKLASLAEKSLPTETV